MQSKVGVIDLGSNSLRLLICRVDRGEGITPLRHELVETRLAEGLQPGGQLCDGARQRTLQGLGRLLDVLRDLEVQKGVVAATSAVREASDGRDFLREAAAISPYPVQSLEAGDEAYYGFVGALQALKTAGIESGGRERVCTCDLGGRSTEFSWEEAGAFQWASLPAGAVGLQEKFLVPSPREGLEKLKGFVRREMDNKMGGDVSVLAQKDFVGLGGTVTTLAALVQGLKEYRPEQVHGFSLSKEEVSRWQHTLFSSSLEERRRLLSFAPQRADIIQAGTAALLAIMEYLNQQKMRVSCEGLLFGLAAELASSP